MIANVIILEEAAVVLDVVGTVLREAHRQERRISRDEEALDLVSAVELCTGIGHGIQVAITATEGACQEAEASHSI